MAATLPCRAPLNEDRFACDTSHFSRELRCDTPSGNAMEGVEKGGEENLTRDTPPKKEFSTFGPPSSVRFPPPSGVIALFFLYKSPQLSRPEALLEGFRKFSGGCTIRFEPPDITAKLPVSRVQRPPLGELRGDHCAEWKLAGDGQKGIPGRGQDEKKKSQQFLQGKPSDREIHATPPQNRQLTVRMQNWGRCVIPFS